MFLLLVFIGFVIGATANGPAGGALGAVIGLVVGLMVPRSTLRTQTKATTPPPLNRARVPEVTVGYGSPKPAPFKAPTVRKSLRWVGADEMVEVQGRQISGGMFYVHEGHPTVFEPSAIRVGMPAGDANLIEPMPYYPSYDTISSGQRGVYLDWLAGGRRDADPQTRELGYLFLFFYGLERRVLVERDFSPEIGKEIAELMELYAPCGRSKSLPTYFSQLLHFWAHHQGPERYAELWPWILDLKQSVLDLDELQLVLGSLVELNRTAPAKVARETVYHEEGAMRSAVTTRSPDEFRNLFDLRFAAEFPQGLPLVAGRRPVLVRYRAASAALRFQTGGIEELVVRTVWVSVPAEDRKRVIGLWNTCSRDLTGYVRAKAKSIGRSVDLGVLIAMPREMREEQVKSLHHPFEELLHSAAKEDEFNFLGASALFALFGKSGTKFTPTLARQLAEGIEALGWAMEPDARMHGNGLDAEQEVVIFKGEPGTLSAEFLGHCALIQLAATVAMSDGTFELRKQETLASLVDAAHVSESERIHLRAWSALLGRNLENAPASTAKVAKSIPVEKGAAVAQMLCRMATADKIVTKGEERALLKIFSFLKLGEGSVQELKRFLDGFHEVKVHDAEPSAPGEAVPARPGAKDSGFSIDREKLRQLKAETAEVIQILSAAMADANPEPAGAAPVETAAPAIAVVVVGEQLPPWCAGLDGRFSPIVVRLVTRDSWPLAEVEAMAREHNLMVTAVIDGINEWSDDALGDFLLSGEDPVLVQSQLIPA